MNLQKYQKSYHFNTSHVNVNLSDLINMSLHYYNFNTSHVNVNLQGFPVFKIPMSISIHLMLMLIPKALHSLALNIIISIHLMLMLIYIHYIYLYKKHYFNTSHVNVNPPMFIYPIFEDKFQYISC